MEADGFRDRNRRYGYLMARENARRILADPAALEAGRRHLERFSAGDPHQARGYALWCALLGAGVLDLAVMTARSTCISNPNAPEAAETARRLASLRVPGRG